MIYLFELLATDCKYLLKNTYFTNKPKKLSLFLFRIDFDLLRNRISVLDDGENFTVQIT